MKTLWIKTAVLSSVLASAAIYAQNTESIPNLYVFKRKCTFPYGVFSVFKYKI